MVFSKVKNRFGGYYLLNIKYPLIGKRMNSKFNSLVPPKVLESKGSQIGLDVRFHDWAGLKSFGNYIFIGKGTFIDNCSQIGNFCSISFDVKIGLRNHRLDVLSTSPYFYQKSKGWVANDNMPLSEPVIIGHDVLISANAVIIEGIQIGTGAVVAAGAVVINDVPPYAVVAGVPAKIVKYRFEEEQIVNLLKSEWWLKPENHLRSKIEELNNLQLL